MLLAFTVVDLDSIVRGTTSKEIVQMAKDVGAKKVIVASCAPPIRSVCHNYRVINLIRLTIPMHGSSYPNVYGIDMPARSELVAHDRDMSGIAEAIGADLVIFQKLSDLVSAVRQFNPEIPSFDCSVFNGEYVTGGVDEPYLQQLERLRADNVKGSAQINELGAQEGKGGGAVQHKATSVIEDSKGPKEAPMASSGPMNGVDDTVGLHNSWKAS